MIVREVRLDEQDAYNDLVGHPVQSWEWGEFKRLSGVEVVRLGIFDRNRMTAAYQLTFHPIPRTSYWVGYFPKGPLPNRRMLETLRQAGLERKAVFVKLEPQVEKQDGEAAIRSLASDFDLRPGRTVFTPHTFLVDLTKSEEELLAAMSQKTRYNVRLAQRRGVTVQEDHSDAAFETYLRLTFATAKRQGFYAHDETYHRKMWQVLHLTMRGAEREPMAHLLTATWKEQVLVVWMVFVFNRVLYYPYGASSDEYRELMASNLMMWEAIRFGKRVGCHTFDLWGSLGPDPDPKDPWYGFHRFKSGYGGQLVEFVGTSDLVLDAKHYPMFRFVDDLRWKWLRLMAHFR